MRGEIGTGRDATQMSKWGGHGCGKPRKASSGTPGHVEYTSGLSYLRDKEAGWLSTIPIHHWLRDAPRGVRTLSFQSPPRAGSCSIADRSISVEYWEMRGDRQGTLHTHSLVLIIAPGWAERGKKTYRESVNHWHIIKFFPWPKRQNHGLTARVLSWKSLEKTENRRSVKLSDVKSETLKYTQKQMWGNRKTQLRAWSQKWEKSSKVISASPAQKELSQSALELWPVAIPWTASFPPVENREDRSVWSYTDWENRQMENGKGTRYPRQSLGSTRQRWFWRVSLLKGKSQRWNSGSWTALKSMGNGNAGRGLQDGGWGIRDLREAAVSKWAR